MADRRPLVEVLDRVLDKGIVISYQIDVTVAGLRIIGLDGCTVIASIDTYLSKFGQDAADGESSEALMAAADEFLRHLPYEPPIDE